jgi:dihydropteroate synthase
MEVARSSFRAGAKVLNLTGTVEAEQMFRVAADHDAAVIVCYVQGEHVRAVGDFSLSQDPIAPMRDYFSRQLEIADRAGLKKVLLDPGLGFYYRNLQDSAVRVRHQMSLFLHTYRLRELGCPLCHALPHAFEYFGEEVRCAEPFFCLLAALGGTHLFRTHEVPRIKAVLDTLAVF